MTRFLVSGLINIETTLRIERFPLEYNPVNFPFFGVHSSVSGVGYNLAKALTRLGNDVEFLSLIGKDAAGQLVLNALREDQIPSAGVLQKLEQTPQSVILYDSQGNRQIHTDLKDIQEQIYPPAEAEHALNACDVAVLCNINFSRPLLVKARRLGKPIATDVHAVSGLEDDYNRDFMQFADILFMSHENLPLPPEEWMRVVRDRYPARIIVIGLGSRGCLLAERGRQEVEHIPAVSTRPVQNTIGAGDALFSAFLHAFFGGESALEALRKAVVFASYKIGAVSAADGFLDSAGLEALYRQTRPA
ncbi:MAG: carbohydrate kinase family protein [Chloroflexota bacterium]